jgi:lipoate-protein ligase A
LGAEVTLAEPRPLGRLAERPADCFATTAGGEILVRGRKLVGSAQVRRGEAFLQHGSILLDGPETPNATTLRHALGRAVSFEEVTLAIVAAWEAPF